jgi:hypothetical protein
MSVPWMLDIVIAGVSDIPRVRTFSRGLDLDRAQALPELA